jgi:hypothetical protein
VSFALHTRERNVLVTMRIRYAHCSGGLQKLSLRTLDHYDNRPSLSRDPVTKGNTASGE